VEPASKELNLAVPKVLNSAELVSKDLSLAELVFKVVNLVISKEVNLVISKVPNIVEQVSKDPSLAEPAFKVVNLAEPVSKAANHQTLNLSNSQQLDPFFNVANNFWTIR